MSRGPDSGGGSAARPAVRCRACDADDAPEIVELLLRGFPERSRTYWQRALDRLCRHVAGMADPTFGQVLEAEGRLVGLLLLIPSTDPVSGLTRRNVSSWTVDPAFRGYGSMLLNRTARDPAATLFNISPAVHTRPIIEAQGFRRYGTGRFWSLPWSARPRRATVARLTGTGAVAERFPGAEGRLLADHLSWGCVVLSLQAGGEAEPFLFLPRLTKGVVPSAQLVYCRDVGRFVSFAGPLGRCLLRGGFPAVAIDSDGPIPGLSGVFARDETPKYFKGPVAPRIGDLAHSELVMFGP